MVRAVTPMIIVFCRQRLRASSRKSISSSWMMDPFNWGDGVRLLKAIFQIHY